LPSVAALTEAVETFFTELDHQPALCHWLFGITRGLFSQTAHPRWQKLTA